MDRYAVVAIGAAWAVELLRPVLEDEGDIAVVDEVADPSAALALVRRARPDVLVVAVGPGETSPEPVRQLVADFRVPVIALASPTPEHVEPAYRLLDAGALDVVPLPLDSQTGTHLRRRVRRFAALELGRLRFAEDVASSARRPTLRCGPASVRPRARPTVPTVALASSYGGHATLLRVLRQLPSGTPATLAVVQHTAPGFTPMFAEMVREHCGLDVSVVSDRRRVQAGTIVLAADGRHLVAVGHGEFEGVVNEPVHGERPAADILFQSLASQRPEAVAAVVLSGGSLDGSAGLAELVAAGGLAITQSEDSSFVATMPRAAVRVAGAEAAVELERIPKAISQAVARLACPGPRPSVHGS